MCAPCEVVPSNALIGSLACTVTRASKNVKTLEQLHKYVRPLDLQPARLCCLMHLFACEL